LTTISPLHREREVEYQLAASEAETIVALDSLYPIVENIWQKTKLKHVIVTNLDECASKTTVSESKVQRKPNVHIFQELLKTDAKPSKVNIDPTEDLAALQYTGGPRAQPKQPCSPTQTSSQTRSCSLLG